MILSLAILTAGCMRQVIIPPDSATRDILALVRGTISDNDDIQAIAQINLVTPQGSYPARVALIIKKPSYLRLELLPLFGPPEFFLTVNPQEMRILLPAKGELYRGKPTGENFARFLPWKFDIEEMIAIFAGSYPNIGDITSYRSEADGKLLRIEMKAQSGATQIIWVDNTNRLIKLQRLNEFDKELYTVHYEDYEQDKPIAGKINILMADGVTSLSVKYADLKIEKGSDPVIFNLPVPAGFKEVLLD
jgi:hypothetical protein